MEKLVVEEICKNLKWYERIFVKIFAKIFIKVYHNTRENIVNTMLS